MLLASVILFPAGWLPIDPPRSCLIPFRQALPVEALVSAIGHAGVIWLALLLASWVYRMHESSRPSVLGFSIAWLLQFSDLSLETAGLFDTVPGAAFLVLRALFLGVFAASLPLVGFVGLLESKSRA